MYSYKYALPTFNKDSQLNKAFIVINITACVNVKPPVLSKTEIHTDKKLRQELPAGTSRTNMHIGANMNDL